jgi:fibronectin-binding autotransporter adhesin
MPACKKPLLRLHFARATSRVVLFLVLGLPIPSAVGQSTWIGAGGGLWNDATKWDAGAPNSLGAQAIIGTRGPTTVSTIELTTPIELNRLQVGGRQSVTLSGVGPLSFTSAGNVVPELINVTDAIYKIFAPTRIDAPQLNVNLVNTSTLAGIEILGPLSGSGNLVKQGLGLLAISGSTADLAGDVEIQSGVVLANPAVTASTNNRIVVGPAGRLILPSATSTASVSKPLALAGGMLELRGGATNSRLTLEGAIALSGTSTISVTQSLSGATLAGPLSGSGGVKYTTTSTLLNRDLFILTGANSYNGTTEIDIGPRSTGRQVLVLSAAGLGSSLGHTIVRSSVTIEEASAESFVVESTGLHVTARDRAVLVLDRETNIADDVYLNNTAGFDYNGGISGPGTLSGDLHLGEVGSYVGGGVDNGGTGLPASFGGELKLAGKIHGGALHKSGNDTLTILAAGHTYTGPTEVLGGLLALSDQGRLNSTSDVQLRRGAYTRPQLLLDNRVTNLGDRLPDAVAIRSWDSGQITLRGAESTPTQETIGRLVLEGGHSRVRVTPGTGTELTTLNLAATTRSTGTTAHFMLDNNRARVLASPSALDDDLIPWGVVGGDRADLPNDFATIGPNGIAPYSLLHTYLTDVNTALPTSNVKISASATLTAARTINALAIGRANSSEFTFNLGGHTLVLESGALLATEAFVTIQNGKLTSGSGELVLHTYYDPRIKADLVDNGAQPVAVTFAGRGDTRVSGINLYTGGTTVSGLARLIVEGARSLPEGGDLTLSEGIVTLADAADGAWNLGTLRMRGDTITRLNGQSIGTINATEYLLELGTIEVPLSGVGTLRKQGIGEVSLASPNPNYRGQIVVEQGTLVVRQGDSLGGGTTDESRATIVPTGGALVAIGEYSNELLVLAGDDLTLGQGTWSGPIEVRAPSRILPYRDAGTGSITGPLRGAGELTISGAFGDSGATFFSGSLNQFQGNLKITGGKVNLSGNNPSYSGQFIVDANDLSVTQSAAIGNALVTVLPAGRLTPSANLAGKLHIQGGTLGIGANNIVLTGQLRLSQEVTVDTTGLGVGLSAAPRNATVRSRTTLAAGGKVKKFGRGNLRFEGETFLEGSAEFIAWDGRIDVLGKVVAGPGSTTVQLIGPGANFGAAIEVRQGAEFRILTNGQPAVLSSLGISGSGTIGASLTLAGQSTISPGNSSGTLHLDGDLRLGVGTVYNWELGSLTDPTNCDLLSVTGALDFGSASESLLLRVLNTPSLAGLDQHLQQANLLSLEWKFLEADSVRNFAPGKVLIDRSATNLVGRFSLRRAGAEFFVSYTIPETTSCFLAFQALLGGLLLRQRLLK